MSDLSNSPSAPTSTALWSEVFHSWPKGVKQRGILTTTLNEQVPFSGFLANREAVFLERTTPDAMGGRLVLVPFANIAAMKIIDAVDFKKFRGWGVHATGAGKSNSTAKRERAPV